MLLMTSSLCPKTERQWSNLDHRPSTLENQLAMRPQGSMIVLLAPSLGKYADIKIETMFQNERPRSVNDCCAGILDNLTGMERR